MALINSFGALGSFAGAYAVGHLNASTGGFGASYLFMASSVFLSAIITLFAVQKETGFKGVSQVQPIYKIKA
jgi:hypothetical protein